MHGGIHAYCPTSGSRGRHHNTSGSRHQPFAGGDGCFAGGEVFVCKLGEIIFCKNFFKDSSRQRIFVQPVCFTNASSCAPNSAWSRQKQIVPAGFEPLCKFNFPVPVSRVDTPGCFLHFAEKEEALSGSTPALFF